MSLPSPDIVRRIEDAAAALMAAGNPNPTNDQVRAHLGGGSLSHISPVMRALRARQREQQAEQTPALPPALAQLLTGQLGLLWQAAVKQAGEDTLAAREQADADIARADEERDDVLTLRERVAGLTATGEHQATQLAETRAELKEARRETRTLQGELLTLARGDTKEKK